MGDEQLWEGISMAPYEQDIELAVIDGDHVYPVIFACHRTPHGWVKASTHERILVSPTHWRPWSGKT